MSLVALNPVRRVAFIDLPVSEAQLANIKDGELDTKAPLKADAFWSNSQLPVVCGLENHLEEWGADWYERDAAPFRDKQDFELPPQTKLLKYSPEPTSP